MSKFIAKSTFTTSGTRATITTTAAVAPDCIPIRQATFRQGLGHYLTIDVPRGWDDVQKVSQKVLEFEGRYYCFTGWCSDKNVAYFRNSLHFARIAKGL